MKANRFKIEGKLLIYRKDKQRFEWDKHYFDRGVKKTLNSYANLYKKRRIVTQKYKCV